MRAKEFINEMFLQYRTENENNQILIAFKSWIWIISEEELFDEDNTQVAKDIKSKTGVNILEYGDIYDLEIELPESRPDLLVGRITDDQLHINNTISIAQNPITSSLIKKVAQQLDLNTVYSSGTDYEGEEDDWEIFRDNLLGKIPDRLWHGSNTKWARNILSKGIMPTEFSNWTGLGPNKNEQIKTPGVIFLAADKRYATFHAKRSAANSRSLPVLFLVKIPDPNKIEFDYDVAHDVYSKGHPDLKGTSYQYLLKDKEFAGTVDQIRKRQQGTNLNTQIGIFGYKGRIPATHIINVGIQFDEEDADNWMWFESVEDAQIALALYDEFGYYYPEWNEMTYEDVIDSMRGDDEEDEY